jgi:uncharacterized DUF497 family protein
VKFEWDENKNLINIERRNIDFFDACKIFDYPILKRIDDRKNYGETRYIALGQLDDVVLSLVYTMRNEVTRIISVRRASRRERQIYETYI